MLAYFYLTLRLFSSLWGGSPPYNYVAFFNFLFPKAGQFPHWTGILFCLNFMANLVRHTYNAGYQVGKFYRRHLHKPLRWLIVHAIALIILFTQLAWEGAVVVYNNHQKIYDACAYSWHQLERQFTYEYAWLTWASQQCVSPRYFLKLSHMIHAQLPRHSWTLANTQDHVP